MNIPAKCLLLGTRQHNDCFTCPLCPETQNWAKPDNWTNWEWCKEWLEANKEAK